MVDPYDKSKYDVSGNKNIMALDAETGELKNLYLEDLIHALRVTNWVWNTGSLADERMVQPITYEQMFDLENIAKGEYWADQRLEYDATTGEPVYIGTNVAVDADESGTDWKLQKITYNENVEAIRIQQTTGSWINKEDYF